MICDRDNNTEVIEAMKSHFNNSRVKLPSKITFRQESEACYTMLLDAKSIQNRNMQKDDNAFEGWSISAFVAMNCSVKIILDVFGTFEYDQYEKQGHLGRFLYRAYRFNEQYEWFSLSPYLQKEVDKYMDYLLKAERLLNNVGNCEAGEKVIHNKENLAEAELSRPEIFKIFVQPTFDYGDNEIYRQFPVGLFNNDVSEKNMLFTGKKSAIDLLTWKNDELCVIELKAQNKMVGIVTEIFFYVNYMRDLLLPDGIFTINKELNGLKGFDRGYSNIISLSLTSICGMMLADEFHSLINQEVVNVMNSGSQTNLKYVISTYDLDRLIQ